MWNWETEGMIRKWERITYDQSEKALLGGVPLKAIKPLKFPKIVPDYLQKRVNVPWSRVGLVRDLLCVTWLLCKITHPGLCHKQFKMKPISPSDHTLKFSMHGYYCSLKTFFNYLRWVNCTDILRWRKQRDIKLSRDVTYSRDFILVWTIGLQATLRRIF